MGYLLDVKDYSREFKGYIEIDGLLKVIYGLSENT